MGECVWQIVNAVISLGLITGLCAVIFKMVPDIKIAWCDVWVSAFVTAVLFTIGKLLLGLYIGEMAVTSVFGAAGALVGLVIWVYYSSQIVFLGAELTEVYSRRFGKGSRPAAHATWAPKAVLPSAV